NQALPVDGAMADVSPAVFVEPRPRTGDVLDMDGEDAAAIEIDPRPRNLAAADDPGHVHLPTDVGRTLHQQRLRYRSIGQRLELEVMVVPGKIEAGIVGALARGRQSPAETGPPHTIHRTLLGDEIGADHQL